ncbi:MAG: zinc metallopeptidase [Oscillospiraceae bacterium]|jgi:Zn-dependent membrane protease YugP|nr:zinc metallopeptidase [Oscillospiraceae bacterium]
MYFDPMYYLFVLPALALVIVAQLMVRSAFSKYSKIPNLRGLTGAQAAYEVLHYNGVSSVTVFPCAGSLTDHYDPRTRRIMLSESVLNSRSVAAVGIAAHEAGHAVQHAKAYSPLKIRTAIIPACNIGSSLGIPLVFLGYWLQFAGLIWLGIALFSLAVLFQLVTLPVEFDASRRALATIKSYGLLNANEQAGAKRVLTAAAFTYVAALAQSVMTLLYYISRMNRRR